MSCRGAPDVDRLNCNLEEIKGNDKARSGSNYRDNKLQVSFFDNVEMVQFMAGNMISQCPNVHMVVIGSSNPHQIFLVQAVK